MNAGPMRQPWWAVLVSVAVVAAVAEPLRRDVHDDGFPLSTFPMFSGKKSGKATIRHVVGFSEEGRHRVMPPHLLGTDEIMQAAATAGRAVSAGGDAVAELCREVAGAVADDPDFSDISVLEVRTDTYDSVRYFEGDRSPLRTRVHGRCAVPGRGEP